MSFWLVAAYWIQHHAVYHYIHHADRALVWLNLLFLFPITLLPFATNSRGRTSKSHSQWCCLAERTSRAV